MKAVTATPRRILSLDGGGVRGAFSAAFLAELEASADRPIGEYFDLVAGTSTGGIIAAGLGAGLRALDILELYFTMARRVFRKGRGLLSLLALETKYDNASLREVLTSHMGHKTLAQSQARLLIPAYDVGARRGVLMKTPHCPDYVRDGRRALVDVAVATAAAPTYFPIVRDTFGASLVDGGVFANNPSVLALTEAVFKLNWRTEDIRLLSVGTTRGVAAVIPPRGGLLRWRKRVIDVFIQSQDWTANGIVTLALGMDSVERIDPEIPGEGYALDDIAALGALAQLGREEARRLLARLPSAFFDSPAAVWHEDRHGASPRIADMD